MQFIVGGAHLDATFGRTREEIVADGFDIAAEVSAGLGKDTARAIGEGVVAVADVLDALKPDVLVVYGERFEAFAALQRSLQPRSQTYRSCIEKAAPERKAAHWAIPRVTPSRNSRIFTLRRTLMRHGGSGRWGKSYGVVIPLDCR